MLCCCVVQSFAVSFVINILSVFQDVADHIAEHAHDCRAKELKENDCEYLFLV